jgi:hypothetical protein
MINVDSIVATTPSRSPSNPITSAKHPVNVRPGRSTRPRASHRSPFPGEGRAAFRGSDVSRDAFADVGGP